MGRSVTCNYHLEIDLSKHSGLLTGAMSLKQAKQIGKSYAEAYGEQLVKITVFPQTKVGEKAMRKDFLIIDAWGNIDHYSVQDNVPFYSF